MTKERMKLKIKEYIDSDDGMSIAEVKTDKCDIQIKEWDDHRGLILLPRGTIDIYFDGFKCKNKTLLYEILHYAHGDNYSTRRFSSAYIEFLYPNSPPMGYNLDVEYIDAMDKDEYKEMVKDWDDKLPYREYLRAVNYINDVLYEARKIILSIVEYYQKQIDEALKEETEQ